MPFVAWETGVSLTTSAGLRVMAEAACDMLPYSTHRRDADLLTAAKQEGAAALQWNLDASRFLSRLLAKALFSLHLDEIEVIRCRQLLSPVCGWLKSSGLTHSLRCGLHSLAASRLCTARTAVC